MTTYNCLFELLRFGLRKSDKCQIPEGVNWSEVYNLALLQGVEGIALDGIDRCFNQGRDIDIDLETKLEWIGDVQQMESVYNHHKNIVVKLARFYQKHGIKMMLMKGIGLSFDYPVPNHRPCGDIDIYLYGDLEKGDKLFHEKFGITIDKDQHKHTIFEIDGVTVENHYDFANYHKHRSSKKLDEWLKEDANANLNLNANLELGENVYLPSASFNAIFLIRHAASHFAAEEISVFRHIAMGRRCWLNSGSHDAAQNIAFMYSLYESCKMNDIDFGEYVEDILTRMMNGDDDYRSMIPCYYTPGKKQEKKVA